jgi:biopolymer transport protein ExbD
MSMHAVPLPGGEDDGANMPPVAEINVTPFVDVMLVLLVIFMVTAPLMMSQLPITLPRASLQEMGKPRDPLIVAMDISGHYFINSAPVAAEELTGRLKAIAQTEGDNLVYVRADKGIQYGKVVDLLQVVGAAGFYRVSLMAEAPQ